MSHLLRRLKKLDMVIVDQSGFPPHSSRWRGIAPFEAMLAYMRQDGPRDVEYRG